MDYRRTRSYQDELLTCCDCGRSFTFAAGEARFYESKGLVIPPKHCPECRRLRKRTINPQGWRNV